MFQTLFSCIYRNFIRIHQTLRQIIESECHFYFEFDIANFSHLLRCYFTKLANW